MLFASQIVKLLALFSPKIKLFVEGRKTVFQSLESKISSHDKTIWFHAASLGEYEQGLPVMEKIKIEFPNHKIVVTFFSPSGMLHYNKRDHNADFVMYLPLDTPSNASQFIQHFKPHVMIPFLHLAIVQHAQLKALINLYHQERKQRISKHRFFSSQ